MLPPILETERRDEETFWREFEAERPRILGGLLDVLADALYRYPDVKLPAPPRMADFARFSTAAELALGWEHGGFLAAYAGNRRESVEAGLDAHALAPAIRALIDQQSAWTGTASELLTKLNTLTDPGTTDPRFWPKTAAQLGKQIKRLAPALRTIGIEFTSERRGHDRGRLVTLQQIPVSAVRAVRSADTDEKPQDLPHDPETTVQLDADGLRTEDGASPQVLSASCPPTSRETGSAGGADSRKHELSDTVGREQLESTVRGNQGRVKEGALYNLEKETQNKSDKGLR